MAINTQNVKLDSTDFRILFDFDVAFISFYANKLKNNQKTDLPRNGLYIFNCIGHTVQLFLI
jgi:hypothetical protein